MCDYNCCCDKSCTDDDKKTFSGCQLLAKPIITDPKVEYWNCTNSYLKREDWFPFLCIHVSCFNKIHNSTIENK